VTVEIAAVLWQLNLVLGNWRRLLVAAGVIPPPESQDVVYGGRDQQNYANSHY
jgi:hypothetical protein